MENNNRYDYPVIRVKKKYFREISKPQPPADEEKGKKTSPTETEEQREDNFVPLLEGNTGLLDESHIEEDVDRSNVSDNMATLSFEDSGQRNDNYEMGKHNMESDKHGENVTDDDINVAQPQMDNNIGSNQNENETEDDLSCSNFTESQSSSTKIEDDTKEQNDSSSHPRSLGDSKEDIPSSSYFCIQSDVDQRDKFSENEINEHYNQSIEGMTTTKEEIPPAVKSDEQEGWDSSKVSDDQDGPINDKDTVHTKEEDNTIPEEEKSHISNKSTPLEKPRSGSNKIESSSPESGSNDGVSQAKEEENLPPHPKVTDRVRIAAERRREREKQRQERQVKRESNKLNMSGRKNRQIVHNAVRDVCLAGRVNHATQLDVIDILETHHGSHYVLLLRDVELPVFKGLYWCDDESDQIVRLYPSRGVPKILTSDMVAAFFKYDSGGKQFRKLAASNFNATTDAVALLPIHRRRKMSGKRQTHVPSS